MPQIKIVSSSTSSNNSELFLLEFQGKFETNEKLSLNGMEIGKLDLTGVTGYLYIQLLMDHYINNIYLLIRINQFIMLEIKD